MKAFTETGISTVSRDEQSLGKQGCYDLSGRRMDATRLQPGIYIVDGRKVVKR